MNNQLLDKQSSDEHFFYFDVPNYGESHIKAIAGDCQDESIIRKVDIFNEEYRFKEKGAILNWFDITEIEGYFSLNDKLSDVMDKQEARDAFLEFIKDITGDSKNNDQDFASMLSNNDMMKMMGGFTVIRLTSMLGTMNLKVTKEQLLDLNAKLNTVKK